MKYMFWVGMLLFLLGLVNYILYRNIDFGTVGLIFGGFIFSIFGSIKNKETKRVGEMK